MPWSAPTYTGGIVWQDQPSHTTPLNAADLNTEENAEATYAAQVGQSVVNYFDASVFYARNYGVKADGKTLTDAAVTAGGVVSSPSYSFTSADVGKLAVAVYAGTGGTAHIYSTIASVASGSATLANTAIPTPIASGGEFFFGTDDTTGIQNCLNAAAGGGTAVLPTGDIAISAPVTTGAGALGIVGQGALELFPASGSNLNYPTVAPYLRGSVLVQCSPNVDIIQMTPAGTAQSVRKLGLRFAGRYISTGHGLNSAPSVATNMGNINGTFEDVRVYGHDGGHYGFVFQSQMLCRYAGLRAYGGGGMNFFMAAGLVGGNYTASDCYTCTLVSGAAHGLFLDGGTGASYQYCVFQRCQAWVFAPTSQPPGTTAPTSAQFCLKTTNPSSHLAVGFSLVDFETNVGSKAQFPYGFKCFRTNDPSAAVDAANTVTTSPSNATGFQNVRGADIMSVHTFVLQPLAAASASTTLSALYTAQALTLTVTSATGFAAGQGIQVDTGSSMEFAIIKSIAGNVLTLITPGGFGLLQGHASGATVAAGAAVVIAQTNNANTWDGARWEIRGAAIGSPASHTGLSFPISSDWWGRLDWANSVRAGSNYALLVG